MFGLPTYTGLSRKWGVDVCGTRTSGPAAFRIACVGNRFGTFFIELAKIGGYPPYGAVSLFEKFNELHAEYVIHAKSPEQELSELAFRVWRDMFAHLQSIPNA